MELLWKILASDCYLFSERSSKLSQALTSRINLISISEAAKVLESTPARLYRLVRSGAFPPGVTIRLGKARVRFVEDKLRTWQSQNEQFISVREAARLLEASPKVIRASVASGLYGPPMAVRVGGRIRFHRDKLLSWICDGGTYQPTQ